MGSSFGRTGVGGGIEDGRTQGNVSARIRFLRHYYLFQKLLKDWLDFGTMRPYGRMTGQPGVGEEIRIESD